MAVRSLEELMNAARSIVGESTAPEALGLFEDITDTYTDLNTRASNIEDVGAIRADYENQLKALDASWSERYRDRFFNGGAEVDPAPPGQVAPPPANDEVADTELVAAESITYDDLFSVV